MKYKYEIDREQEDRERYERTGIDRRQGRVAGSVRPIRSAREGGDDGR